MDTPHFHLENGLQPLLLDPEDFQLYETFVPYFKVYASLRRIASGDYAFREIRERVQGWKPHGSRLYRDYVFHSLEEAGLLHYHKTPYGIQRFDMRIRLRPVSDLSDEMKALFEQEQDADTDPVFSCVQYFRSKYRRVMDADTEVTWREVSHMRWLLKARGGRKACKRFIDRFFIMADRLEWNYSVREMYMHREDVAREMADVNAEERELREARARDKERAARTPEQVKQEIRARLKGQQ